MLFDYSLAAAVTAGLLVYLTYALLPPERFGRRERLATTLQGSNHDPHRLDPNRAVLRRRRRAGAAARRLHDARIQRRVDLPVPRAAPGRGRTVLGGRRRSPARAALGHLHRRDAVLPHRRIRNPLRAAPLPV